MKQDKTQFNSLAYILMNRTNVEKQKAIQNSKLPQLDI